MEKYNEIQLTKKMGLNNQKMKNHPPSPRTQDKQGLDILFQ